MNCLMIASHFNFEYKSEILKKMHEFGIKPTERFIEIVEKQISNAKQTLAEMVMYVACTVKRVLMATC